MDAIRQTVSVPDAFLESKTNVNDWLTKSYLFRDNHNLFRSVLKVFCHVTHSCMNNLLIACQIVCLLVTNVAMVTMQMCSTSLPGRTRRERRWLQVAEKKGWCEISKVYYNNSDTNHFISSQDTLAISLGCQWENS